MKKTKRMQADSTPVALAVSVLCAAAALYCSEILYGDIKDSVNPDTGTIPEWRAHMAAACVGATALVISLFFLERIGGRSRNRAIRSVLPWLPVVAVTGLAAIVHIPSYLVLIAVLFYSPWAYSRMRAQAKPGGS
jgi:hypothetical protein